MGELSCCEPDFHANGRGFIQAFNSDGLTAGSGAAHHVYEGQKSGGSEIRKFVYDHEKDQLLPSPGFDQVVLKNELVSALLEYAVGRLIVATEKHHLLLFEDWSCTRVYSGESLAFMRSNRQPCS